MDVAFQCGCSRGYHVNAEAVILEVVDEVGKPVLPGHEGRLVLTNLNNYAMPFVRYATGDLGARWPNADACACGRGLPLLAYVKGRTSDQLVLPDGTALVMWYFTTLFRLTPGIDAFQVRQTAPDKIRFLLVPGEDFGHLPSEGSNGTTAGLHSLGSYVGVEGIMAYLQRRIASQVRGQAQVELHLVDVIPSGPAGKRRFFVADDVLES
jgi:phenylacetate-CoA ligase